MLKNPDGRKNISRVLRYIGRYKILLPISILLAAFTVGLTLYVPILIGEAIDLIGIKPIDFTKIADKLLLCGVLVGITAMAQWIMNTINNRIAFNVERDIRNEAFAKTHTLPLSYHDQNNHGITLNRIINDSEHFTEGLLLGFSQLFTGALTILATLVFMLYINWIICLVVVILTPLSLFIAKFIGSKTYNMFRERSKNEAATTSYVNEILGNQKLVKAFSYENEAEEKFGELNSRLEKSTLNAIFFSSLTNPTTRFVNNVVYAAVALTGAIFAITSFGESGAFTIGELACLLSYTTQYTKPFNEISGIIAEFQSALASAGRVFELIEEKSEDSDASLPSLPAANGNVRMDNVSFSYNPEKPLLQNISFEVEKGQKIAIVGPTGCGKTTLINLLMRFYDVNDGKITVDGTDITMVKRKSLRASYGMVLQDTWLRQGTIRENIAQSKPDATDEEIVRAAKAAHAHSFIKRLKNGYDTEIGEGGEGLSGGQKQLLCITRVMLSLPPMLILDEATSSIDTRTEIKIQKAFSEMMRGRTSFIVAHRLSTIREADLILVMKDGNIIETGNHTELLERGGFYASLYNSQFAH